METEEERFNDLLKDARKVRADLPRQAKFVYNNIVFLNTWTSRSGIGAEATLDEDSPSVQVTLRNQATGEEVGQVIVGWFLSSPDIYHRGEDGYVAYTGSMIPKAHLTDINGCDYELDAEGWADDNILQPLLRAVADAVAIAELIVEQ